MKPVTSPWFPIPQALLDRLTARVALLPADAFDAHPVVVLSAGGGEGIQIQDGGEAYWVSGWQREEPSCATLSVSPSCVDQIPGTRCFLAACQRAAALEVQPQLLEVARG